MNRSDIEFLDKYQYIIDELKAGDSWRIFRILSEFVEGFDMFDQGDPMISIFGSAQTTPDNIYYQQAELLAGKLASDGVGVITGGGPGIMEAANKGAYEAGGKSIGVEIDLPLEQEGNHYTNQRVKMRHFFVRKVMLIKYSNAFVIFPGGFGTLDEVFEALTLTRTKRMLPFPVIMVGVDYWRGMLDWLQERVLVEGNIDQEGLDSIELTDDLDRVVEICKKSIEESTKAKWLLRHRVKI